jgi:hypothetical protein
MLHKRLPEEQKKDSPVQMVLALLQVLWHKQYEVNPCLFLVLAALQTSPVPEPISSRHMLMVPVLVCPILSQFPHYFLPVQCINVTLQSPDLKYCPG